ncbi:MATE family efflux transporter [Ilumatobacter coccineus]|uniref:Putative MatE family transporter n=1 Tax=Ilumatobacter coccineus (strain NBRC 103263 / KCTC 29153 / YM16-304) TaxID=1313172 RepID=A0A6C7EDV0_ILUCY|nr:MATE family efflux transporter [Ilumatobacter coccineus]BAN02808.1 putative MatE family transporter [Ilumatobacter coccineus YM16-304]
MQLIETDVDRRILKLAVPAFGALAAEPLYRLVDTAIVGRLGKEQLGGVAVAVSVLSLVIAGSNFLAYGTTQRVANRLGADDRRGAADVGVQAFWLALLIGVVATPLLVLLAEPLTRLLGADDDVLAFATTYLRISALGVPFVVAGLAAQGTQRGASDYRTSLVVLVAANVLNAGIEVVLVFGFDLGVAGAAWSTVVAQVFAGLALWWRTRPHTASAGTRRPLWSEMLPLLAAGRHLLLRVGAMLMVFTGATSLAARIDDATLAAHSIAVTMFLFLALTLDALAVPAQTLVAEELGKGGPGADEVSRRAVRLSVFIGIGLAIVLAAASPLVSRIFSNEGDVTSRATVALLFLAVMMIPGSVAFATDGSLIGAGDYEFLGRAALGYLLAVIPIAAAVVVVDGLGIAGIWLGLLVWMTLRAAVNHRRAGLVLPAPAVAQ